MSRCLRRLCVFTIDDKYIVLIADSLGSLAATSQKDLAKEQKDNILKASEVDFQQELTRACKEMVEIEHRLRQLKVDRSNEPNEEAEQSRQELLQEVKREQAANIAFRDSCEEALSKTVYERTGQKIRGIKATDDSLALAGFINASGEELKINQDISDVSADNRSFAAAGVIKHMDFKDRRPGRHGGEIVRREP